MTTTLNISNMNVLSIDDNANNLMMIEIFSKKLGLHVNSYTNPIEALESAETNTYDIVVVDYMMPGMNGIDFIIDYRKRYRDTPIVMVTAAGDSDDLQLLALEAGATDFLRKPLNGAIFQTRMKNLLQLKKSMNLIEDKAALLSFEVEKATTKIKDQEREALKMLSTVAEYRDPETNRHVLRVAHYSKIIAKAYGLNEDLQDLVYNASTFHDIGKVGIPDSILLKADQLTKEEWQVMRTHSELGYKLLNHSKSPILKAGSVVSYSHHEKYDGSGYPNGLKGEFIPLYGRIVAVADVFDALCSPRPYKKKWTFEDAMSFIIREKGKHFDPKCVDGFVNNRDKVFEIYKKYEEVEA